MTNIANIIKRTPSQITFQVNNVDTNEKPLLKNNIQKLKNDRFLASSYNDNIETIDIQFGRNILARAVHLAHDSNYPLLLTPDIIWMVIAQGFTQHINNQPALCHKFINHQNKVSLKVQETKHYNTKEGREIVSRWGLKIKENIDPQLHKLMLCDFTTTIDTVYITSKVVMTKTYQQYFDYRCIRFPSGYLPNQGIPNITLLGTVDDWKTIRDRVNILTQYDLQWWTNKLLPICDEFINTSVGKPSLEFWQQIYKRNFDTEEKIYSNNPITGWLLYLFPYLPDSLTGENTQINKFLLISDSKITAKDGVYIHRLPVSKSETTIRLQKEKEIKKLELTVGFISIVQNDNNCLKPEIGWELQERDNLSKLIDVLAGKDVADLYPDWSQINCLSEIPQPILISSRVPRTIIQLSKKLSDIHIYPETKYSWYFKTPQEYKVHYLITSKTVFVSFIELNDRRCIAYGFVKKWYGERCGEELWIVVGKTKIREEKKLLILKETKVIAKGITQLLERIITADGKYYFDDPSFIPDDSLDVL